MSIVKGTSGFLDVAANLIPNGTYTIAMWFKTANAGGFESFAYHANTASNAVRIDNWGGMLRHRVEQAFGSAAEEPGGAEANVWQFALGSLLAGDNYPRLVTDSISADAGGAVGSFQIPVSPAFRIFGRPDDGNQPANGGKVGMVAFYGAKLDATDEAHLVAGGDPTALPSETTPTALWIDSAGVGLDGSNNVTSWTDQVGGLVLSPSGAVTSDADAAPVTYSSSVPSITNIDTDNAVNQYQQAVVNVSDFTETITSVTLGGVACAIPENNPTDEEITIGVPGSLTTGTYDLVISGSSETDTLEGVSYTQTHARPAFDGLVDSNSILSGQSYTANTYFRFVTSFSNGTLDTAAGDAAEWAGDIADYYTPDEGFTGDDTVSIQFLYSDGTTSATVGVTVTVASPVDTTPDQFDLGANVTGAEPGATVQRTFVVAGIDTGETVNVTATGSATVSPSTAQLGDTITVELTAGTFEAVVSGGAQIGSVSDSFSVTTRAAIVPVQDVALQDLNLGENDAVLIDLDDYFSGAASYSVSGLPAGSGLSFDGTVISGETNKDDIAGSPFTLTVTATSAEGSIQDSFSVTVVDDIAPAVTIGDLTTLDTTPTASGSAGDATGLALVVEGVDVTHTSNYNPVPSNGNWSQQLNELAVGTYTMTLTGTDDAGNERVVTATLKVVDEITTSPRGLFQPLFRSLTGSVNQTLFR